MLELITKKIRSAEEIVGVRQLTTEEISSAQKLNRALLNMYVPNKLDGRFIENMGSLARILSDIKFLLDVQNQSVGIDDNLLIDNQNRLNRVSDFGQKSLDALSLDFIVCLGWVENNLDRLRQSYAGLGLDELPQNIDLQMPGPFLYETLYNAARIFGIKLFRMKAYVEYLKLCFYNKYEPLAESIKTEADGIGEGFWEAGDLFKAVADNVKKESDWSSQDTVLKVMSDLSIRPFMAMDVQYFEREVLPKAPYYKPAYVADYKFLMSVFYKKVVEVFLMKYDQFYLPHQSEISKYPNELNGLGQLQQIFDLRDYRCRFLNYAKEELAVYDFEEVGLLMQMHKLFNLEFQRISVDDKADNIRKWNTLKDRLAAIVKSMQKKKTGLKLL